MKRARLGIAALCVLTGLACVLSQGCGDTSAGPVIDETRPLVTQSIGPDGGTISVPEGEGEYDGVTLVVPPGALETEVEITLSAVLVRPPVGEGVLRASATLLLTPEGITFEQPVLLSLPYDDTEIEDESQLEIYRYANETWSWAGMAERDTDENTITTSLMRFSEYEVQRLGDVFLGYASALIGDPRYNIMAAHVDGDVILIEAGPDGSVSSIRSVVFLADDGTTGVVFYGDNHLPEYAVFSGNLLLLGNYTATTVDLAIITPELDIFYHYGMDWSEYSELLWPEMTRRLALRGVTATTGMPNERGFVSGTVWVAILGLKVVGAAYITIQSVGVATPAAVEMLGSAALQVIALGSTAYDPDLEEFWDDFSIAACGHGSMSTCAEIVAMDAAEAADEAIATWWDRRNQVDEARQNVPVGGGICPTFIQPPPGCSIARRQEAPSLADDLVASIRVPTDGCLLRSDVPIYGYAGGREFARYRVEVGAGSAPAEWTLVSEGDAPVLVCPQFQDLSWMQGDLDLRGNLATWNTGLRNWEHLPWHPADDPTDFKGIYTIRLVVESQGGQTVEDRVICEVGNVIAQCSPGRVTSPDGALEMVFDEHSLPGPFRVYSATRLPAERWPVLPSSALGLSDLYALREPGELFMRPVDVSLPVESAITGVEGHPALMWFDGEHQTWRSLHSTYDVERGRVCTSIVEIPEELVCLGVFLQEGVEQISELAPPVSAPVTSADYRQDPAMLIETGFSSGAGDCLGVHRSFGALVETGEGEIDDSWERYLTITNQQDGGTAAALLHDGPFSALQYPTLEFRYCIDPGFELDLYLHSGGRWFCVGFTDSENDFRYRDVAMRRIGTIPDVRADGSWHLARVDLATMLAEHTSEFQIDKLLLADWDVTGFMELSFGENVAGATLRIDDLRIWNPDGPSPQIVATMTLDDFTKGDPAYETFGHGTFSVRRVDALPGAERGVLVLNANFTSDDEHGGLMYRLQDLNLGRSTAIALRYAGDADAEMGFGPLTTEQKIRVERYVTQTDAGDWRQAVVPLAVFGPTTLTREVLSLSVAGRRHTPGDQELLVDEIGFVGRLSDLNVADFEGGGLERNLVGGESRTFASGAAEISAAVEEDANRGKCLRLGYGGSIGSYLGGQQFCYGGWRTELPGLDLSLAHILEFDFRGDRSAETCNIYLDDGNVRRCVQLGNHAESGTGWRRCEIRLSEFADKGVDLTHIEGIELVMEWEPMEGRFLIDDLRFSSPHGHEFAMDAN